MKKYLILLTSLGIILSSCGKDDPEVENVVFDEEEVASIEQLNRAAFKLYDEFVSGQKESYAFSPLSIEFTLGMESNSVEHPGLVEFLEQNSLESGNSLFDKIGKKLNQRGKGNETTSLSNALFNNTLYPKDKNLNSAAKDSFKADIFDEDFTDYEAVMDKIHDWLMKKSKGFLNIPKVDISPSYPRVLCNAMYFKHDWAFPFREEDTKMEDFTGADGNVRKVPMMNISNRFNYFSSSSLTALEMPYANNSFSMTFILSDMNALSFDDYKAALKGAVKYNAKVSIPRFDTETAINFSMEPFGYGRLCGLHLARVKTDEIGTEAAAVTELFLGASNSSSGPVVFKADHPFFYVITDNATGLILFIGRYC